MSGLALGSAMILWPKLGTAILATSGRATPTDFGTALYIAGDNTTTVGASDLSPQTTGVRLFYAFNSFVGISCLTLMITYLLEIYNALHRRNAFARKLHVLTAEGGDAADIITLIGPDGRFDIGYAHLVEIAAEVVAIEESHHFYSALFYFRFRDPHYAISRIALILLDTISLIKSALSDEEYGWLKKSAAVEQTWRSTMTLLTVLAVAFLPEKLLDPRPKSTTSSHEQWEARYRAAIAKLERAGIRTLERTDEGAQIYIALRMKWDPYILRFAEHMAQDVVNIDLAMHPRVETPGGVPSLHATG
jgi:hypothetical protein